MATMRDLPTFLKTYIAIFTGILNLESELSILKTKQISKILIVCCSARLRLEIHLHTFLANFLNRQIQLTHLKVRSSVERRKLQRCVAC